MNKLFYIVHAPDGKIVNSYFIWDEAFNCLKAINGAAYITFDWTC